MNWNTLVRQCQKYSGENNFYTPLVNFRNCVQNLQEFAFGYQISPSENKFFRSGETNVYFVKLRYCNSDNTDCCPEGDFEYTLDQLLANYGYHVGTWGPVTDPTKQLSISFLLGEPGTQQDIQNQVLKDGDQVAILVTFSDGIKTQSRFLAVNTKTALDPVFMLSPSSWSGASWFIINFFQDGINGDIGFKLSSKDTGQILGVQGTSCQQMMYAHDSNTKDAFFYVPSSEPIWTPAKRILPPDYTPAKRILPPEFTPAKRILPPDYSPAKRILPPDYSPAKRILPPDETQPIDIIPPKHNRSINILPPHEDRPINILPPDTTQPIDIIPPKHGRSINILPPDENRPINIIVPKHSRSINILPPNENQPIDIITRWKADEIVVSPKDLVEGRKNRTMLFIGIGVAAIFLIIVAIIFIRRQIKK